MANIIGYNNNVMFNTAGHPFYCVPSTGSPSWTFNPTGTSTVLNMRRVGVYNWTTRADINMCSAYGVNSASTDYINSSTTPPSQIGLTGDWGAWMYTTAKSGWSSVTEKERFKGVMAEYALTGSRLTSGGKTYSGLGYWGDGYSIVTATTNNFNLTPSTYTKLRISGHLTLAHHTSGYPCFIPNASLSIPDNKIISGSKNLNFGIGYGPAGFPSHTANFDMIVSGVSNPFVWSCSNSNIVDERWSSIPSSPTYSGLWDYDHSGCYYKIWVE